MGVSLGCSGVWAVHFGAEASLPLRSWSEQGMLIAGLSTKQAIQKQEWMTRNTTLILSRH